MSKRDQQSVESTAADLLVTADLASRHPDDDATFSQWRKRAVAHEAAAVRLLDIWHGAEDLRVQDFYPALLGSPTWRERIVANIHVASQWFQGRWITVPRLGLATACVAIVAVTGLYITTPSETVPAFETKLAEVREVSLDDGSVVTLGAKSALIDVNFSRQQRVVKLGVGEAFFEVTGNKSRPFKVAVGDTIIRVVGTKFNVKFDGKNVKVSVLEGVVEVLKASKQAVGKISDPAPPLLTLTSGQQATLVSGELDMAPKALPIVGEAPGVWREGRLSYEDASLAEVVADANRYRSGIIRIMSPALASERITTSFRTSQVDQMLDTLPDTVGVKVIRNDDGSVDLRKK